MQLPREKNHSAVAKRLRVEFEAKNRTELVNIQTQKQDHTLGFFLSSKVRVDTDSTTCEFRASLRPSSTYANFNCSHLCVSVLAVASQLDSLSHWSQVDCASLRQIGAPETATDAFVSGSNLVKNEQLPPPKSQP